MNPQHAPKSAPSPAASVASAPVAAAPSAAAGTPAPASMAWVGWFAAGALGFAAVIASFFILPEGQLLRGPDPGDGMTAHGDGPDQAHAERIRRSAYDACHEAAWMTCVTGLDEAKALDPAGDEARAVQDARRAAGVGTSGALRH